MCPNFPLSFIQLFPCFVASEPYLISQQSLNLSLSLSRLSFVYHSHIVLSLYMLRRVLYERNEECDEYTEDHIKTEEGKT
jgi:hypothetical protein